MANAPYCSGTVTVGTSPTLVCSPGGSCGQVLIQNNGAAAVFLGSSSVAASGANAGISVAAAATVTVPCGSAHDLYAIIASGTAPVAFLYPS